MIRVFVIDDHPMIIEGIKMLLHESPDITLVGSATDGFSALAALESLTADVVLLDINLPDMDGIELCRQLKSRYLALKVLGLSTFKERSFITRMLEAGASGYLLKNATREELEEAVITVSKGRMFLDAEVSSIVTQPAAPPTVTTTRPAPMLTAREKEVLGLIADGYTNQQIAGQLYISHLTVDSHRKNLLSKFEVSNTAALIKYAVRCELVA